MVTDLNREMNKYRLDHQIHLLREAIEQAEGTIERLESHIENMRVARNAMIELRQELDDVEEVERIGAAPVVPSLLWRKP